MSVRHTLATGVAPIFLRAALGLTFVWAGLGKLMAVSHVGPADAAILANLGVVGAPAPQPAAETKPDPKPTETTEQKPEPKPGTPPEPKPESKPEKNPDKTPGPSTPPAEKPAPPPAPPPALMQVATGAVTAGTSTAADFPEGLSVRRMHAEVALRLHKAAFPPATADGTPGRAIWPSWAAEGRRPVIIAWTVVLTDVIAGAFLLLGLLTRLSAAILAGHMLGAMWLAVIGPAIQSGRTVLGFLPAADPWDSVFWSMPLWQLSILAGCMALVCLGSGALGFDRAGGSPTPPKSS